MGEQGLQRRGNGSRSAASGHSSRASRSTRTFDEACSEIASRFRSRRHELEEGLADLIGTISDPSDLADPNYLNSLPANRTAIIEYAADVIEVGERRAPDVPPTVLASARWAARSGVALDTLLRRYSVGNAQFCEVLIEEAERIGTSLPILRRLLRRQATAIDRMQEMVSEEYAREVESRPTTTAEWRREYIKGLIAGRQPSGDVELDYDLDGHHLGMMAKGEGARELMRELAKRLDRRLLAICREEEPVWACWLGGRRPLEAKDALRALDGILSDSLIVTVGEPDEGLSGWRLSHRQAKAALPIAERGGQPVVRYADVALQASILRDDLVTASLHQLYLEPLEKARDGGKVARETLRTYFAAERNISSTAAALGVDRRTVTNRIRAIEELLGRPLKSSATDLEIALRLAD